MAGEIYASYPRDGGLATITTGTLVVDFGEGKVNNPDEGVHRLTTSLKSTNKKAMRSCLIEADKDVKIRLDDGSWFTKDGGIPFYIQEFPFVKVEVEFNESTKFKCIASTSFVGFSQGGGAKKKLDLLPITPWVIQLDTRELDITSTATDKEYADRTLVDSDLFNSKDGSNGEIEKVELILNFGFKDDSGAVNYLECSDPAYNQHQIRVGGGAWNECPFSMHGAKLGQHISGDCEVNSNGAGSIMLMADISDMLDADSANLKANVLQQIEIHIDNAEALGNNLHCIFTTYIRITYLGTVV